MKVLLIWPPYQRLMGYSFVYYPVGISYISGTLRKAGHESFVYNMNVPAPGEPELPREGSRQRFVALLDDDACPVWQELRQVLREQKPDMVGISTMTIFAASARRISRIVKQECPDAWVVWGGPHPTSCDEEVLRGDSVEFCARREGEETMLELVNALAGGLRGDFSSIPGLSWRSPEGKCVHNPDRTLIKSLDEMPHPDKDNVVLREYYQTSHFNNVFTARGCPFKCNFCAQDKVWTRVIRYRSLASIKDEIDTLVDRYGFTQINFMDDTFTADKKRTREISQYMKSKKLTWNNYTRADCLTEDLVKEMADCGCTEIGLGLESASEGMLKHLVKDESVEEIERAMRWCQDAGMVLHMFVMTAIPDETQEDFDKTLAFMKRFKNVDWSFGLFGPLPDTGLYDIAVDRGLAPVDVNWEAISRSEEGFELRRTKHFDQEGIQRNLNRLIRYKKWDDFNRLPLSGKLAKIQKRFFRFKSGVQT